MIVVELQGHKMRQQFDEGFTWVTNSHSPSSFKPYPFVPQNTLLVANDYINEADFFVWLAKKFKGLHGPAYFKKRREVNKELQSGRRVNFEDFIICSTVDGKLTYVSYDGEGWRQAGDCEANQGVHDLIDQRIPSNTYGVEKKLDKRDKRFARFHEITERGRMSLGETYDRAHDVAVALEKGRRNGCYPGDKNYPDLYSYEKFVEYFKVRQPKV